MLFGNRFVPVHTVRDVELMLDSNMIMSQQVSMSRMSARTVISNFS